MTGFHPTIVGDCLFQVVTSHCCCKLTHANSRAFFTPIHTNIIKGFSSISPENETAYYKDEQYIPLIN